MRSGQYLKLHMSSQGQRGLGRGSGTHSKQVNIWRTAGPSSFLTLPYDIADVDLIFDENGSALVRFIELHLQRPTSAIESTQPFSIWADRMADAHMTIGFDRNDGLPVLRAQYLCIAASGALGAGGWKINVNGIPNTCPSQPPVSSPSTWSPFPLSICNAPLYYAICIVLLFFRCHLTPFWDIRICQFGFSASRERGSASISIQQKWRARQFILASVNWPQWFIAI